MFKFLQSKKGFTLIELMIVLILLGLGAFALINLFRVAYRSFDKTEERYIKQEAVKNVVELLQKGTNISAAKSADIFATNEIVPTGDKTDKSYSYLFAQLEDRDGDGSNDGYYLYVLNKGKTRDNAILLADVPMYILIDAYQDETFSGSKVYQNKPAAKVRVMALEDDFDYDSGDLPDGDSIYYELTVTYHFPNMATSDTNMAVNFPYGDVGFTIKNDGTKVDNTDRNKNRSSAGTYGDDDSNSVTSVDEDGLALRVFVDSILDGDNSEVDVSVPSFCFIATASYGVNNGDGTVGMLCDFRDTCLLTNPLGTAFVKAYYKLSPPIADVIAQHEPLRATVRVLLKPLVVFATYALNPELIYEIAPVMIITFAAGLALSVILVRMNKKRKKKE